MRLIFIIIFTIFCSTTYAQNTNFTEDQFINLLVQIKCIQKTTSGITQEMLLPKITKKANELDISNFTWERYLNAHKYYTSQPDFLEKNMLKIGNQISACVQKKLAVTPLNENFYGVPVYSGCALIYKVDSSTLEVALIRIVSKDSLNKIFDYYKDITKQFNPSISKVNEINTIEFKQNEKGRVIMLEKAHDGTEITINVEK